MKKEISMLLRGEHPFGCEHDKYETAPPPRHLSPKEAKVAAARVAAIESLYASGGES